MQFQHVNHLTAYLETMDTNLEIYQLKFEQENKALCIVKTIKLIRKSIRNFLSSIGVHENKKDLYNELHTSCMFFEDYLVEIEPKRFQKGYGKLDSADEEAKINELIETLSSKIQQLKKYSEIGK
jgi:hypothetical protein